MSIMKRLLVAALLFAVGVSAFSQVVLPEKRNYSFEEVYDFFVPTGTNDRIWIYIDGDIETGRVSFLQGKNPLTVPDAKGELMKPDPKFKTVYCGLHYDGGEESRSFHLTGCVNLKDQMQKDCPGGWVKIVTNFRPRRKGKIRIRVFHGEFWHWWYETKPERTQSYYPNVYYAQYCNFEFKNIPDKAFKLGSNGWGGGKAPCFSNKIKAEWVEDKDKTAPASKFLRTPFSLSQTVKVDGSNEGKVVCTFSFYVHIDNVYRSKY